MDIICYAKVCLLMSRKIRSVFISFPYSSLKRVLVTMNHLLHWSLVSNPKFVHKSQLQF